MSTATVTPTPNHTRDNSGAVRRIAALTRANAVLMARNRLTLFYGTLMPLIPMALLISADGDTDLGATAVGSVLLLVFMFPVFYNLLSLFVTRRDELVLKRLRTGETRDHEQLISLALPGSIVALVIMGLAVGVGIAFDLPVPTNPLLYAVTGVAGAALATALAFMIASFTRTAEAAQITSMPVIVLFSVGTLVTTLPDRFAQVVEWTPMAAIDTLMRISWFGELNGSTLTFSETWSEAAQPLVILIVWTVVGIDLARRHLRWEPRA